MRLPVLFLLLATACSEPAAVAPVALSIEPGGFDRTLRVGSFEQLHAHARASDGADLGPVMPTWSSSDTTIAKVSANGELRLSTTYGSCSWVIPGECRVEITARSGALVGRQVLTVMPFEPTMELNAMHLDIEMGDSARVTAVFMLELRRVDWCATSFATRDAAVADVDTQSGVVLANDSGSTVIDVIASGPLCPTSPAHVIVNTFARRHTLTIEPGIGLDLLPGGVLQLTALVQNYKGVVYPAALATWVSADPAVASVDAKGLVRANACSVASCQTTITARTGRLSASTVVTVRGR